MERSIIVTFVFVTFVLLMGLLFSFSQTVMAEKIPPATGNLCQSTDRLP